ncbi:hypothetical protein [Thiosocius teredinicola]|uniref:hypothetical protein n=1 Tax=Thiosocius teredinicola TaxID=1973002 RepID=UPI000F7827C0
MLRNFISLMSLVLLASCATTALPPDYSGPVATIQETAARVDSGKAQMFFLSKIDGNYIEENSSARSFQQSYGNGNNLTIVNTPYQIPAQAHTYTITGSHVWAMDGRAIFEDSLEVSGEVTFTPKTDHTYLIGGELKNDESRVWIKDNETGEVVAEFAKRDP